MKLYNVNIFYIEQLLYTMERGSISLPTTSGSRHSAGRACSGTLTLTAYGKLRCRVDWDFEMRPLCGRYMGLWHELTYSVELL